MDKMEQILEMMRELGMGAQEAFLVYLGYNLTMNLLNWAGALFVIWVICRMVVMPLFTLSMAYESMKQLRSTLGVGRDGILMEYEVTGIVKRVNELAHMQAQVQKRGLRPEAKGDETDA